MLIVSADLIWPEDEDTIELAIFGLLHRHGGEGGFRAARSLASLGHMSSDNLYDVCLSKGLYASRPDLPLHPSDRLPDGE